MALILEKENRNMSVEENDNYYVLEEEQEINETDQDQSPLNYAAYEDHDDSVETIESAENANKGDWAFGLLFRIMFNPVEGWKQLRRSHVTIDKIQSGCFYPILAFLAISVFADYFYSVNIGLSQLVTEAVVTFVAFFFGYFCIQMVLSWILPKDMALKFEEPFGKEYLSISLSTLALFSIITNLLPMLWPILIFLPIWSLYLMFKGIRFFHFEPNQEMKFFVLSGASVIGVPLLIEWALNTILPY